MRIAIDARLNAYRQGGIPQYTRQLITALADFAPDEQIISFQHRDQLRPIAIAPNVTRRTAVTPPHHRFEQWTLPLEVLFSRPDVMHFPDFIAPLRRPCPAVVTIHDLAFMHYPEILDQAAKAYYSQVTANAPRADAIIAVSEATRQDIAQFLDIPIEQIDMIHEAAAPLYTRLNLREGEARVLTSTPVAANTFMLFVSTLEPRKNLPTLLRALRICLDRKPAANYRLVVVGRRGWRDDDIFETVRDLKLEKHVLFAGGIGQYDLRWLYNACRIYINPSLYEGFGLPLLEAMACGAACLAAATSSLPEIGGDAAIYVPPLEAEQWADAIAALWEDQDRREELGRMGMARAQQFSWTRAARETLKVYERAAKRIIPRATATPALRPVANQLAPALETAVPAPGAPRPCLRCGAALRAGELQSELAFYAAPTEQHTQPLVPRVWTCARCGFTELVAEQTTSEAPEPLTPATPALVSTAAASETVNGKLFVPTMGAPSGQLLRDGSADGLDQQPAWSVVDDQPVLVHTDLAEVDQVLDDEAVLLHTDLAEADQVLVSDGLPSGDNMEPDAVDDWPLEAGADMPAESVLIDQDGAFVAQTENTIADEPVLPFTSDDLMLTEQTEAEQSSEPSLLSDGDLAERLPTEAAVTPATTVTHAQDTTDDPALVNLAELTGTAQAHTHLADEPEPAQQHNGVAHEAIALNGNSGQTPKRANTRRQPQPSEVAPTPSQPAKRRQSRKRKQPS